MKEDAMACPVIAARSHLTVETIRDGSQFSALGEDWDALCRDSAGDNVFLSWDWIEAWWQTFGDGKELAVAMVHSAGRLVAIAPLYRSASGTLRWLGSGESVSPDHLAFIIRGGCEDEALAALVPAALAAAGGAALDLTDVPAESATARWMLGGQADGLCRRAAQEWAVCPYAELPGDWDAFEARLSANMRYNLRRRTRRLMRDLSAELVTWHTEDECRAGLDEVARLHRLRWQGRAERFGFSDPSYLAFHGEFARRAARRGWLRMYGLRIAGQVIAAWYGFRRGDTLYYYQSGFDPSWEKHSPGMVLKGLVVREAIGEGARELDLLKGDHEYKQAWATGSRRTVRIVLARRGLRGCAALAPMWIESRKQRLKAMLMKAPWAFRILRRVRGSHANVSAAR